MSFAAANNKNRVMNAQRLIDQEPLRPRTKEMKVLNLGYPRTATLSMYTALAKLGYRSYHMAEVFANPNGLPIWEEALRAHYLGQGKKWGREEFDKMLGDYDATCDVPCCMLVDELLAAYPDVKVILTERNVDSWLGSMQKTFWQVRSWKSWDLVAPWHPMGSKVHSYATNFVRCWAHEESTTNRDRRQVYLDHYDYVKKVVPKDRLLAHKPQDGWEPLCTFLGHEIPNEPYPNINDSGTFVNLHSQLWWASARAMVWKAVVLPVGVAAAAAVFYSRFGGSALGAVSSVSS